MYLNALVQYETCSQCGIRNEGSFNSHSLKPQSQKDNLSHREVHDTSDISNLLMSSISPVPKEDGKEGGNSSLKSKRIVERQEWKK